MATHILLKLNNQPSYSSSPSDIFKSILEQVNEWISFLPNLFHSLVAKFDDAFPAETRAHWLAVATQFGVAALGVVLLCLIFYCFGPAIVTCITWVLVAIWNLIAGFITLLWSIIYNVVLGIWKLISGFITLLCSIIYKVIAAIWKLISGFIKLLWRIVYKVITAIWKLIKGFIKLLWRMINSVYRVCCCCGRRPMKMMTAPGTGGLSIMPRALFQSNPAAYFSGLRAGSLPAYVS